MELRKTRQTVASLLRESVKTPHSRIVTCGLLVVGLGYLPPQLYTMLLKSLHGSATVLMLAVICLGMYRLWQQRHLLMNLKGGDEDRFIGHTLILSGVVLFPFCLSSVWSQALLCWMVLAAIACSTWGLAFFRNHPLPIFLVSTGLIPNPGVAVRAFWETFVPSLMLERFTAWLGLLALLAIDQPATLRDNIITLANRSVQVSWGCTGFNMALSVAIMGMLLGLFFKQNLIRTVILMIAGIVLAVVFNIPRMVLLAMATTYWGDSYFHFWHEGWGAQIFSAVLFTAYYYIVMPFIKRKSDEKALT
jgi:exosortase